MKKKYLFPVSLAVLIGFSVSCDNKSIADANPKRWMDDVKKKRDAAMEGANESSNAESASGEEKKASKKSFLSEAKGEKVNFHDAGLGKKLEEEPLKSLR